MLTLHPESHLEHVPPLVLGFVLGLYHERDEFFSTTFKLPDWAPALENALYGPSCGDEPVPESEVFYAARPPRTWNSRLVDRPKRLTRIITVVGGPSKPGATDCVLYTVYGGAVAPREMTDPNITRADLDEAAKFWAQHALAK
jgi:hypothetical protein